MLPRVDTEAIDGKYAWQAWLAAAYVSSSNLGTGEKMEIYLTTRPLQHRRKNVLTI
jgi:hypothetical protein